MPPGLKVKTLLIFSAAAESGFSARVSVVTILYAIFGLGPPNRRLDLCPANAIPRRMAGIACWVPILRQLTRRTIPLPRALLFT
jgi:hypothetical protein